MVDSPDGKNPAVLSYLDLRKAIGFIALGLPFALAIPWWLMDNHAIQLSLSSYYYTAMRNVLVGSLCAISMFMLCFRGYDRKDQAAGIFSAICLLGVAFFPTMPDSGATPHQQRLAIAHYTFATVLFCTFAYFCLALFKMTAEEAATKPRLHRLRVGDHFLDDRDCRAESAQPPWHPGSRQFDRELPLDFLL